MTLNNLQDATVILVIVVVTVVCVCLFVFFLFLDIFIFFVSFASYECHNIAILSCVSQFIMQWKCAGFLLCLRGEVTWAMSMTGKMEKINVQLKDTERENCRAAWSAYVETVESTFKFRIPAKSVQHMCNNFSHKGYVYAMHLLLCV